MKRLSISVLLCLAAVVSTGQATGSPAQPATSSQQTPVTAEDYYRLGVYRYELDDREGAVEQFREAIKLDPLHAMAYLWRSLAYDWLGQPNKAKADYDAAMAIINKAIAAKPENAQNYAHRAWAHRYRGDYKAALADFDKALALDPKNAEAYFERGRLFGPYELKDQVREMADYDLAILHKPDHAKAYEGRARIRADKKDKAGVVADLDKAILIYSRAIERDPRDAVAYRDRANARKLKIDILKDLAGYQKAPSAKELAGTIADFTSAIADYDRALMLNPTFLVTPLNRAWSYVGRGEARFSKGDFIDAFADLDKAVALDAGFTSYTARARAREERGDLGGAIADYDKLIELQSKKKDSSALGYTYEYRGRVRVKQKDYDGAIADFNKALEVSPKSVSPYFEIAEAQIKKGDLEGAAAAYTKAIALHPDWANNYANRGFVRLRQNRDAEAEQDFQKSIELDPKAKAWIDKERNKIRPKPTAKRPERRRVKSR